MQRKIRKDKAALLEDQWQQIKEFDSQGKSQQMFDTIKAVKNNIHKASIHRGQQVIVLDHRESIMER